MKKIISLIIAAISAVSVCTPSAAESVKGVWLASVYNIDYPSAPTADSGALRQQADEILDDCADMGFNTIFLQVRPESDALYKSDIFPYSKWLTGTRGLAPSDSFDPLEYFIEEAHSRSMELHAWINPYRVTTSKMPLDSLAENSPARLHPEYTIQYSNGNYYYNPAMPEVRRLICDGVAELADNYAIDGIHMDDYFYPGSDIDDASDYEIYNTDFDSVEDWRRNNCDLLIEEISREMKQRNVKFGISPCGVWSNRKNNPKGSDTNGFQSYYDIYADSLKWAREGLIDYIIPQLYWEIGNTDADYGTLVKWWCSALEDCDTKLYIGMADYKCDKADSETPWFGGGAIRDEFILNKAFSRIAGEVHYSYSYIKRTPALREIIRSYYTSGETGEGTSPNDVIFVYLNGSRLSFDCDPVIKDDYTLVPVRAVFEALGMELDWDQPTKTVSAADDRHAITLKIGSKIMYADGSDVTLGTAPVIESDRTLVPLRAISEAVGADVEWDGELRNVYIRTIGI